MKACLVVGLLSLPAPALSYTFAFDAPMAPVVVAEAEIIEAGAVMANNLPDVCSATFARVLGGSPLFAISYVKPTSERPGGTVVSIKGFETGFDIGDSMEVEKGVLSAERVFSPDTRWTLSLNEYSFGEIFIGPALIREHLLFADRAKAGGTERLAWRLPSGSVVVLGPLIADTDQYRALRDCVPPALARAGCGFFDLRVKDRAAAIPLTHLQPITWRSCGSPTP